MESAAAEASQASLPESGPDEVSAEVVPEKKEEDVVVEQQGTEKEEGTVGREVVQHLSQPVPSVDAAADVTEVVVDQAPEKAREVLLVPVREGRDGDIVPDQQDHPGPLPFPKEDLQEEESSGDGGNYELSEENVRLLRRDLDEAKSAMAVAECIKESMVELERRKTTLEEELATMQQLLSEAHDEASATRTSYEHQLAKTKAIVSQLENENHELRIHLKLGGSASDSSSTSGVIDKDMILGGAAVLSDATRSFARRMKSNLLPTVGLSSSGDKSPSSASVSSLHATASSSSLLSSSAAAAAAQQSLEDGMKKAYEDTELLKSIVVPLEEQIGALKDKLRQTDSLLRQHEERESRSILATGALGEWLQGRSLEEAMAQILERAGSDEIACAKETLHGDVYIALMSTRYALLVSDLSSTKRESADLLELLNKERSTTKLLKREAVISSSEIVRSQREHLVEIARLQSVLSEEQKAELAKLQSQSPPAAKSPSPTVDSSTPDSPGDMDSISSSDESVRSMARIVSNVEWEAIQRELNKVRAMLGVGASGDGGNVVASDRYRALQNELIEEKKQKTMLAKVVEKQKDELKEESVYRRSVEEKWNERAEAHRTETEDLNRKLKELEELMQQLRVSHSTLYEATRKDLQKLTADREKVIRELKRLQEETDVLMGKHSARSQEMQNEVINLPETVDDMQLLLLKFREDLITAKVAKERTEEKLRGEANFLRTQLKSEEQGRKSIEEQFTVEISALRETLGRLQGCKKELEAEQRRRKEVEGREEKQRQSCAAMQQESEAQLVERQQLEAKTRDMRSRLTILQQELDNSVGVQNDFVRLSQSLQMELEKIRQSEKEVRWQHEDDIDNCQNCKISLTANKRKHHCRHCGRIFCSECVTKSVNCGPRQRPAKVCDVCHTLLVQNSAPYFSTEVPHGH